MKFNVRHWRTGPQSKIEDDKLFFKEPYRFFTVRSELLAR